MKGFIVGIIALIVFLFGGANLVQAAEYKTITEVTDINKIKSSDNKNYKLYGIDNSQYIKYAKKLTENQARIFDAKEILIKNTKKYSIASEYKNGINLMEKLLIGRVVTLKEVKENQYIAVVNDININEILLSQGYAKLKNDMAFSEYDFKLILAEDNAREEKKGVWGEIITLEEKIGATVINDNGIEKFTPFIYIIGLIFFFILSIKKTYGSILFYIYSLLSFALYYIVDIFYLNIYKGSILIIGAMISILTLIMMVYINNVKQGEYYIKTIIGIVIVVLNVITFFGGIYYAASNNPDVEISTKKFSVSDNSFIDDEFIIKPRDNYLEISEKSYIKEAEYSRYFLNISDSLYYSSVTFFTVGFGDIYPVGMLKMVSTLEMMIGYFLQTIAFVLVLSNLNFKFTRN